MTTFMMNAGGIFGASNTSTTPIISPLMTRALEGWAKYKEYRLSVAELSTCSDRVLRDLGIYRGDIRRISREAVYQD